MQDTLINILRRLTLYKGLHSGFLKEKIKKLKLTLLRTNLTNVPEKKKKIMKNYYFIQK